MAGFTRTKRVTDPLDDRVKNRIFGREKPEPLYFSSGSEHSGQNDDGDDSPCLSDLLYGFLPGGGEDQNDDNGAPSPDNDSDSESDFSMCDRPDAINGVINRVLLSQNPDRFRNVLSAHVCKAMEVFSLVKKPNKSLLLGNVMAFLRNLGYNAAICKTKWECSGGLTAGNYEFIDVVRSDSGTRYFVDIDFAGEFEIARQTSQYRQLLQSLPRVFIGKCEDLKQIVKTTSDAAKRSLKSRGLHLPPWRKNRFMQNKYFGPYRRTVNFIPTTLSSLSTPAKPSLGVKCRSVGFSAGNAPRLFSAATRTR